MIAQYYFGIKEKKILDAIRYHTTGCAKMGKYGKIVYCADKLDPFRGWDSKDLIDDCLVDIDKGFVDVLKHNRQYLKMEQHLKEDDVLTKGCVDYYLKNK